jgi:hypothetical protein
MKSVTAVGIGVKFLEDFGYANQETALPQW